MSREVMRAINETEYKTIIETCLTGGCGFRANDKIALMLEVEAMSLIRISDVLNLKPGNIECNNGSYRINIIEIKTAKARNFALAKELGLKLKQYAIDNNIGKDDCFFNVSERAVQKYLKKVCDYIGLENVSTHSFRKFGATRIYNKSGHDIEVVRRLLQHSSSVVTQRYLGISDDCLDDYMVNIYD